MGKLAELEKLVQKLETLGDKIQRGDILIEGQRRTNPLSPTSTPPKVKGLRDETFVAPAEESEKASKTDNQDS